MFGGESLDALHGLGPGMERQVECAVVDGDEPSAPKVLVSADGLFRLHVDDGPAHVVGAVFEESDSEWAVLGADITEAGEVAGVCAVEDAKAGVVDDPGAEESLVAVPEAAAGEVLRGRGGEANKTGAGRSGAGVDFRLLVPFALADFFGVDAPAAQVIADAARDDEPVRLASEFLDGALVEVVVVVVGEDDGLERREIANGDGRLMEAFGTGEPDGRGAMGEDWVREPEGILQLNEDSGVAETPEGAIGGGFEVFPGEPVDGDLALGSGVGWLVVHEFPEHAQSAGHRGDTAPEHGSRVGGAGRGLQRVDLRRGGHGPIRTPVVVLDVLRAGGVQIV